MNPYSLGHLEWRGMFMRVAHLHRSTETTDEGCADGVVQRWHISRCCSYREGHGMGVDVGTRRLLRNSSGATPSDIDLGGGSKVPVPTFYIERKCVLQSRVRASSLFPFLPSFRNRSHIGTTACLCLVHFVDIDRIDLPYQGLLFYF